MRFRSWGRRAIMFGALAAGLTGCTNESPSLRIISVVPPADMPISFATDVQFIFTRSCAKSGCHAGSTAAFIYGLSLEEGQAYGNLVAILNGNLVGIPSGEDPTLKRVEPGRSDLSYIIRKLEGTGLGERMPFDGPPYLPDAEIQLIRDWIDQGALDN